MRRGKSKFAEEPFQMAPMIDMVFLLLVFFMTVGTLAQDARPELELAESMTVSKPELQVPRMILTLSGDENDLQVYVGASAVSEEQAVERIGQSVAEDPSVEWELRVGREVSYRLTGAWMERCTEAGVTHLHLSVYEK